MFDKEAKEYADKVYGNRTEMDHYGIADAFQEGAEFGYNKANEWHYPSKGELPNKELEEKQLLVRVRNYTEDYFLAYYMLDEYYRKNGKRFYFDNDCDYPINIKNIIAWKEIIPPELEESE